MNRILPSDTDAVPGLNTTIGIVILSDVRFVREALVAIFERSGKLNVLGVAAELDTAFEQDLARQPDIVLIDTTLPDGRVAVPRISQLAPATCIVAFSLTERDDEVLAFRRNDAIAAECFDESHPVIPLIVGFGRCHAHRQTTGEVAPSAGPPA